ncbi:hypothetical protein ACHAQJ_005940 [Trichoderma viride]
MPHEEPVRVPLDDLRQTLDDLELQHAEIQARRRQESSHSTTPRLVTSRKAVQLREELVERQRAEDWSPQAQAMPAGPSMALYLTRLPAARRFQESLEDIDAKRQEAIGKMLLFLHGLIDDLQEGKTPCNNGCDTVLLGVLVKALHRWKLAKPYKGVSFYAPVTAVRDIQDEVWYTGPHPPVTLGGAEQEEAKKPTPRPANRQNRYGVHHCGFSLINPKLYELEVALDGLTLKSAF